VGGAGAAPPGDILATPGRLLPPSDFYPVLLLLQNADFRVNKDTPFRRRPIFFWRLLVFGW